MEKEATINSLFGETIYCTNVDNDNQTIAKYIESFVKEKPGRTAATTDVKGNTMFTDLEEAKDNLHKDKKYSSLFIKLKRSILEFMTAKGYNPDKFDVHITKAWATYTVKDQHIASHKHTASHFSFVYYVRNNDMGNIRFEKELAAQTGLFIPPTDQYIVDWNQFNFSSYIIPVRTNNLIVFPSGLLHYTEVNTQEEARISISGDILLTMKPGIKTEHCIPHPSGWDTISN
jgi:uncharacterized protein (TIGR02466 family)